MFDVIFQKLNIPIHHLMLNAGSKKQKAIADNLANVMTPGYKRKDVDFADIIRQVSSDNQIKPIVANPRHISGARNISDIEPRVIEFNSSNGSGNNINLEEEMADNAKNQLFYGANAHIIGSKFKVLKACIRGRF